MSSFVKDINEADFQAAVIERSAQLPVLVDFWAPWCGPCRTLGPLLEKAVQAAGGRVELVKINTDANQGIAARFGIQGIPAVKAFRNGEVVDEFVGAQPLPTIEAFIRSLVPSAARAALAEALAKRPDPQAARAALGALVDDDEVGSEAAFHLAHVLVATGGPPPEIRTLAERVHPSAPQYPRVEALEALADLLERANLEGVEAAQKKVQDNPRDHEARLSLAATLLSRGQTQAAMDALLESVSRNAAHAGGLARKALLAIFDHLEEPPAQPDLVRDYRRQLQIVS
ncbi:MAG: tetratricopeptide repeat protein [Deltaproteobacteria bacterium]|nr:tetratricopeptide repeat protein [Deltaproteobacteria bacterium]